MAGLSKTLAEGLQKFSIGEKIRALRLRKKMRLVELGQHTELSPAMLSKLESGKVFPTLPTLLRIALVFNVGLDHFFQEDPRKKSVGITRKKERIRLPERFGGSQTICSFESLTYAADQPKLSGYIADFDMTPPDKARPHTHAGFEMVYVLNGTMALAFAGKEHILEAGDSVYFDSSLEHAYRRTSRNPCQAIVVTTA